MARRKKKSPGLLTWLVLIVGVIVIVRMFSAKPLPLPQPPPPAQPIAQFLPPPAPAIAPPSAPIATESPKTITADPEAPEAKTPSTPRSRVLFTAGRNLEKMGKNEGAIHFYRQVVMECRRSPESDEAIVRLKRLKGEVPGVTESIPPREGDHPVTPPKRRKRDPAIDVAWQQLDQMMSQEMQAALSETNGRGNPGAGGGPGAAGSHRCGAPTLNGTPCKNLVPGAGYCYLHQ